MIKQIYPLLQLCDSQFPSGAFSHSFGFETYIQEGKIMDSMSFEHALRMYVNTQLLYTDGFACRLTFEMLEKGDILGISELDHELFALAIAKETREGNRRIGSRMVKVISSLYPSPILEQYETRIKNKKAYGHSSIGFASVCHHLSLSPELTVSSFLFANISTVVQNAVRGIPIGQTEGQQIMVRIQPFLEQITEKIFLLQRDEFGLGSPGLEIAQMRHEELNVRLFMS